MLPYPSPPLLFLAQKQLLARKEEELEEIERSKNGWLLLHNLQRIFRKVDDQDDINKLLKLADMVMLLEPFTHTQEGTGLFQYRLYLLYVKRI